MRTERRPEASGEASGEAPESLRRRSTHMFRGRDHRADSSCLPRILLPARRRVRPRPAAERVRAAAIVPSCLSGGVFAPSSYCRSLRSKASNIMEKAPVQGVVVAQPNQVANPPGTPPGGAMIEVAYCGLVTWIIGILLCPCVCGCPCDKMTVYRAPDGTLYNMQGAATKPACMKM